jgi:lipopolysaccharide biosynthesis glycosyltransferase
MPMNIVFTANENYAQHLAVALCSLLENNRASLIDVYVINADITPATWNRLDALAARYQGRLINTQITDDDLDDLVTKFHFRKESYYRLLIAEKIPVSKAMFLDADIVVNAPIGELYDTNIDDCYLAAVLNPGFDRHGDLEMHGDSKYFNAGVMLLNLEWFRRDHLKERVLDFVRRKPLAVPFLEQCGLNAIIDGRWTELHPKFNLQGCFFEGDLSTYPALFPDGAVAEAIQQPVVIHYSGTAKPWHFGYRHPYAKLYWKYLRMTSFNRVTPNDLTLSKLMKRCVPDKIKRFFRKRLGESSVG